MALKLFTASAVVEDLLLADAKALLRIDTTADDTLLTMMLGAARRYVEGGAGLANRALLTQTWDWTLDRFPSDEVLYVPLPPLQSVTSITVKDAAGASAVWSAAAYQVDVADGLLPGRILPIVGGTWPVAGDMVNAITIRFVAGYGTTAADIPQPIRLALLGLAGQFYTNRDSNVAPPAWVDALLAPYHFLVA